LICCGGSRSRLPFTAQAPSIFTLGRSLDCLCESDQSVANRSNSARQLAISLLFAGLKYGWGRRVVVAASVTLIASAAVVRLCGRVRGRACEVGCVLACGVVASGVVGVAVGAPSQGGGGLDPSLGVGGETTISIGGAEIDFEDAALQPDGKIVLVGKINSGRSGAVVVRLDQDGSLDKSFGSGGRTIVGARFHEEGMAVALQPDGK